MSRTVTITKTGTTPKTVTQNVAIGRMLNNKLDIKSKREQLVNTYLTFAYEMRPGLDNRVFWKYVILLLFSIDQIAGVVTNNTSSSELYAKIDNMTGTVPDSEQIFWSRTFETILKNCKRINASTTRPLYNRLPKL
uniref:Uncharacterized protein n=1 Tax=Micromonas commoda virus TaxID=3057169 RepID=A0AAU7YR55_9PHYC